MAASNELKVGVLVLMSAVVLTAGILFLQEYRRSSETTHWRIAFPQVGGLAGGDPVLVQGVKEGTVDRIELKGPVVVTTIRMNKAIVLTRNSTVNVASQGLVGERVVAIDLGPPGPPWNADSLFPGEFSSGSPEVMSKVGPVLDGIDTALAAIREVADDLHSSGSLGRTIKSADRASSEMEALLTETRGPLKQAVADFQAASASLRQLTTTRQAKVEGTVDRLADASEKFKQITAQFEEASTRLNAVASRIESGDGTLGQLSRDSTVYLNLKRASKNLDDLVKDMKANPKRYLKISIF